jgi:hypothetical protein
MGTFGAGLATTISAGDGAILLALAWPYCAPARVAGDAQWRPIFNVIRLGVPIAIQYELEFGIFATAPLMGRLGPVPASAHQSRSTSPRSFRCRRSRLRARCWWAARSAQAIRWPRRAGVAALAGRRVHDAHGACQVAPRCAYSLIVRIALASALIPEVFQVFDGSVVSIGVAWRRGHASAADRDVIGYWSSRCP